MSPYNDDETLWGPPPDDEAMNEPAAIPTAPDAVNWHVRRARVEQEQANYMATIFDAEIEALKERKKTVIEGIERRRDWHAAAVSGWHRAEFAAGNVGKTAKLPGGTSSLRAQQPKANITDEEALKVWVDEQGWLDKVWTAPEPTFKVSVLKQLTEPVKSKDKKDESGSIVKRVNPDTGEDVPGITFIAMPDRHNIGD